MSAPSNLFPHTRLWQPGLGMHVQESHVFYCDNIGFQKKQDPQLPRSQPSCRRNLVWWPSGVACFVTICMCIVIYTYPVPVAARSKALVCGSSPTEIVVSNPTGGMDVCLLWVLCVERERSLRRADHSSRGVLLAVMRRCVWSRNLKNEEAMARVGLQHHRKYIYIYIYVGILSGSIYRAVIKVIVV